MAVITEAARETPVCHDCDLVVVGGSCTGLFAAVRAARLGLRVALIESSNRFGGVATNALVNVWHSQWDDAAQQLIVGGLTSEVCARLAARGQLIDRGHHPAWQSCFNAIELACELDALVAEHAGIRPFLHARVVGGICDGDRVCAVVIEDKSGRRAISCRAVVDASGDADLLRRLRPEAVRREVRLQPPTTAAIMSGLDDGGNLAEDVFGGDSDIPRGFLWAAPVPGASAARAVFGTRVHDVDCSDADDLTRAEIDGRRQVRAMVDRLRQVRGGEIGLLNIASSMGVRETVHAICHHQVKEAEILHGHRFADTICQGTYRVDVHVQGGEGCIFRYLDGREDLVRSGAPMVQGRWRPEQAENPLFYCCPYRSLVPKALDNCWVAGRCIDSDEGAHGALRVMVNCNQQGEAAGVAAALALRAGCTAIEVDPTALRASLNDGGSLLV